MITKKCLMCGKEFKTVKSRIEVGKGKFCSRECYGLSKQGKSSWNKGLSAPWVKNNPQIYKKGQNTNENHFNWKGDKVGYRALHHWVMRHKGKPKKCEHCGATCEEKRICWANVDHKYRRNLDDFIPLCYSCHSKYDNKFNR